MPTSSAVPPADPVAAPRVALLVPAYNARRFLPRLWEGVRAQVRPFDECWVCDDASSDDTAQVAADLGARVLRNPTNLGPAATRNRLLAATTAEWVHFHDADDRLTPEFNARMLARATPDREVVLCQVDWHDEATGRLCLEWRYRESDYASDPVPSLIFHTVGGIGGLYRRSAIEAAGGFDPSLRFWEDTDFHLRLARRGARFAVVDEVLVTALRRPDSLSNRNLVAVWRAKEALLQGLLPSDSATIRHAIAWDAMRIAERQFHLRDWAGMRRSLALCQSAGGEVPETRSRAIAALARAGFPVAAFVLQSTMRRLRSRTAPLES